MAPIQQKKILVSACLLGLDTRYNGVCKKNKTVTDFLISDGWVIIPVCPEQLAGLSTPRSASRFQKGDGHSILSGEGLVVNSQNEVMNEIFIKGADQVKKISMMNGCKLALLKERSPSCGVHQIYLEDKIVAGSGVTTALLRESGVAVFNEDEIGALSEFLLTGDGH